VSPECPEKRQLLMPLTWLASYTMPQQRPDRHLRKRRNPAALESPGPARRQILRPPLLAEAIHSRLARLKRFRQRTDRTRRQDCNDQVLPPCLDSKWRSRPWTDRLAAISCPPRRSCRQKNSTLLAVGQTQFGKKCVVLLPQAAWVSLPGTPYCAKSGGPSMPAASAALAFVGRSHLTRPRCADPCRTRAGYRRSTCPHGRICR
jgi:hypothetical protein